MEDTFNMLASLDDLQRMMFIRQNYQDLFSYISQNKVIFGGSPEKCSLAFEIMNIIFNGKNWENFFPIICELCLALINKTTYSKVQFIADQFLKNLFTTFCKGTKYEEGLKYFEALKDSVESSMFSPAKTYLMYFAYHTKNYSAISDLMNSIISYVDIEELISNVEYAMYYYYKALIHLQLTEFEKAYISFCVCIQSFVLQKSQLITTLQLEAIKHIIIMSFIPSLEKYKSLNQFLFRRLHHLKNVKELEPFANLYQIKGANFAMWIENNKLVLKQAKLLGLTKIAYKENEKNRLMTVLKKYKKIHLSTLAQMLDLSEESLLIYLRTLVHCNEVNIHYDEVDKIIEVIPVDYCNENMFDKLKSNYECLTNESNDIANAIQLIKNVYLKKTKRQNTIDMPQPSNEYSDGFSI